MEGVQKASVRQQARLRLHYALKDLVFGSVTHVAKPSGRPGYGFADCGKSLGSALFGDRTYTDVFRLSQGAMLSLGEGEDGATQRRGGIIVGAVEPSHKQGGRAKHVFTWWCGHGRQVQELARVVLRGTTLTSQALRRRLRVENNDSLWLIERVVLHNDLQLAETLVKLQRGYPHEFKDDQEKLLTENVNLGKDGAFGVLEMLTRDIDMELAEFLAILDAKYPVKQVERVPVAGAGHPDVVAPLEIPAAMPAAMPAQQHSYVGFAMPQASSAPQAQQWGASGGAGGWAAGAVDYDPCQVPAPAAAAATPPGGATPPYADDAPKTPEYGANGGTTPEYGENPADGSTTPAYASPVYSPVSPQ